MELDNRASTAGIRLAIQGLVESKKIRRKTHLFFSVICRNSRLLYVYIAAAGVLPMALTEYIVRLHKDDIAKSGGAPWLFQIVIPAAMGILFAVASSAPLLLVLYNRSRIVFITERLGWILDQVGRTVITGPHHEFHDLGAAIDELVTLIRVAPEGSSVFILTPNGVYLLADRWLPEIRPKLQTQRPTLLARLEVLERRAPDLRHALIASPAKICFILPDTSDAAVNAHLRGRIHVLDLERLGVREDFFVQMNEQVVRWVRGDLTRDRGNRETVVKLTTRSPHFRYAWARGEGVAFIEELPPEGPGIEKPPIRVDGAQHGAALAAIDACLTTMREVL